MERHYVIFEGADRSGKTTSKLFFNEETKYRHYVIDRLFYSNYLYDMLIRSTMVRKGNGIPIFTDNDHFKEVVQLNSFLMARGKEPILFVLVVREPITEKYSKDQEIFISYFKDFTTQTRSRMAIIYNNGSLELLNSKIRKLVSDVQWGFL